MYNSKKSPRTRQAQLTSQGKQGVKPKQRKSQLVEKTIKTASPSVKALPHRYKTQMCKNFESGIRCPFGPNCNYAHGERQLERYLALQHQVDASPENSDSSPASEESENFTATSNLDAFYETTSSSLTKCKSEHEQPSSCAVVGTRPDWVKKLINSGMMQHMHSSSELITDSSEPMGNIICDSTEKSHQSWPGIACSQDEQILNASDHTPASNQTPQQQPIMTQRSQHLATIEEEHECVEAGECAVNELHQEDQPEKFKVVNYQQTKTDQTKGSLIQLNAQTPSTDSNSYKPIYSLLLQGRQDQGKHLALSEAKTAKSNDWDDFKNSYIEEYKSDSIFDFLDLPELRQEVKRLSVFEQLCLQESQRDSADEELDQNQSDSALGKSATIQQLTQTDSEMNDGKANNLNSSYESHQSTSTSFDSAEQKSAADKQQTSKSNTLVEEMQRATKEYTPIKIKVRSGGGSRKCRGLKFKRMETVAAVQAVAC